MQTPEAYTSIPRRQLDLSDYVDIARRNRGWIIGPVLAGLMVASVIAYALPNQYVSRASLRITPQQISEAALPSIINQQLSERLNQMEQDILSRTSLSELIQRPQLDLYHKERERQPLDDVIEKMRTKDLRIQVVNQASGSSDRPSTFFTIEYKYRDRFKAKAAVDALVTRFMESNLTGQRAAGNVATGFFEEQLTQAKADLDRLNNQLTAFRERYNGRLPEQLQVNMQALSALESQRGSIDEALNRNQEEKLMLESQLQSLENQKDAYAALTQQNVDEASVPGGPSSNQQLQSLNRTIGETEMNLSAMRERYTDSHPDVRSLQATLTSLKKQRDDLEKQDSKAEAPAPGKKSSGSRRGNAVAAVQMSDIEGRLSQVKSQLKALDLDRDLRKKQADEINGRINNFQSRVESGPANEQQYAQLVSDQHNAEEHYQDLLRKVNLAQANEQAEVRKAGPQLEVLDPASQPEAPTAPNRMLIVGIGFGVGLVAGCVLAALREIKDTSLKNLKDVRAYTQLPILGSVPMLENDLLVQKRRRTAFLSWSAAIVIGAIAVSASLYYHYFVMRS